MEALFRFLLGAAIVVLAEPVISGRYWRGVRARERRRSKATWQPQKN